MTFAMNNLEPEVQRFLVFGQEHGHSALQNLIALRRWPDGQQLDATELPFAMQGLLLFEHHHVPLQDRTAFIHKGSCSQ